MLGMFDSVSICSAEVDGSQEFAGDIPASQLAMADEWGDVQVRLTCRQSLRLEIRNDSEAPLLVAWRVRQENSDRRFGRQLAPGEAIEVLESGVCIFWLLHAEAAPTEATARPSFAQ